MAGPVGCLYRFTAEHYHHGTVCSGGTKGGNGQGHFRQPRGSDAALECF